RIGRIHRLGQHKPVNIINFISKGTIEENLLGLLSFKKSVFAGVLDNGENIVFMGEGKLKQFMNSVAKVVEPTEQSQEPLSVETPVSTQPTEGDENPPISPFLKGGPSDSPPLEKGGDGGFEPDLNDLFKTGISFLEKMSQAISEGNSLQPVISSIIEIDKDTGKSFLKIPVPDEDTISKALSTFGKLLQGLKK
ncbi:MAG TPA: hypothetical protein VFF47_03065, partial [Nitrospirota bacterium]|nr:hypothetical protein [Nitrospirota bacterium]